MKPRLPEEVIRSLAEADRTPGWNNRSRQVRRFDVAGGHGHVCTLYVVPFRLWANRRTEKAAAAWRDAREQA